MKDENAPHHQLDHAEPTVIHHPEEDMTILARWLQRAMEQGVRFWFLAFAAVAAVVGVSALVSGLAAAKSTGSEAWTALTQAKTAEERIKIADAHANSPVSGWAKLLAAQEEYENGVEDLTTPGKKELAGPRLKKALGLFQQVAKEAAKDSSEALGGLYGAARTLEARNELPEAIDQYKLVAERFPKSPEAKQSLELAKALQEPVNQEFYKELYAYKPPAPVPTTTQPGMIPGAGSIGAPGSLLAPPTLPGIGSPPATKASSPDLTPPAGLDAPPATNPTPKPEAAKAETPKAEAPKAEAPATSPAPADASKPK